ncbi:MAG: EAL domain-containing protein [Burkholderiaceae bacterium]
MPAPLKIRVLADQYDLTFQEAIERLPLQRPVASESTKRAVHFFWVLIDLPKAEVGQNKIVTIQDKYLRDISVWALDADNRVLRTVIGDRGLSDEEPLLTSYDGGYAWHWADAQTTRLLVKTNAVGAATLRAGILDAEQFEQTFIAKERLASGVTAALISVAVMIGVIGALAGSHALVTCSIWVGSLWLVTAISLGYDLLWIPVQVPGDIEAGIKQLILVGFGAATFAYFLTLFTRQVAQMGHLSKARHASQIAFGVAAIAAPFMPNAAFMPPFYLLALVAIGYMTWIVSATLTRRPTHAARAFAYLWGIVSLCILAEIAYASNWIPRLPGLSFETGAIFAALAAAYGSAGIFRSERIRSFAALSRSRHLTKRYRRMYRGVPVGLVTLNRNAEVVAYNRLAAELLAAPLLGQMPLSELLGDVAHQLAEQVAEHDDHDQFHFEAQIPSRDGARILHLHAIPENDGVQIAITDFSVHAELEETLRRQLTHDQLTGVLSYLGLERALQAIEARLTSSQGVQFACIHLNLDNFSAINDVFGRHVGDEVLLETVRRINFELSATEFHVARPGADDFVVLIKCSSLHWTRRMGELLVSSIGNQPVNVDGVVCRTTASAGIAFMLSGIPAHEVLDQAGRACTVAKRNGGDQISVFDTSPSSMERYRSERAWESLATQDNLLDGLEIWAQPIVPLLDPDAPLGLEVLLRVRQEGRLVSPVHLIEAATKVGRMPVIDRWVLSSVVELMRDDHRLLDRIGFITVNLSGASLNSHAFVDDMRSLLHANYLHCSKLCIEITEQVALVDVRSTQRLVDELRMFGVQIGLDDFGAGNTSFSYLRDLNADILKMDGAYVRNMEKDPANAKLVEGIAGLSRTFGMACIAEWIENEDTARLCAEFGIEYGQGFLFARPEPILDWLDGRVSLNDSRALFMKVPAKVHRPRYGTVTPVPSPEEPT